MAYKSKKIQFSDTNPDDYAWSSIEKSLEFTKRITAISIDRDENAGRTTRLKDVLDTLTEFSPVKIATLWKLKGRAKHAAAIARTQQYADILDPTNSKDQTEYVCPFKGSHIEHILEEQSKSNPTEFSKNFWSMVDLEDISKLSDDPFFNTKDRIINGELKRCLSIPFGGFCPPENSPKPDANYLLNLYLSENNGLENKYDKDEPIPDAILSSVVSKLRSGVCALIDRRLTDINQSISRIHIENGRSGADHAIEDALMRVIPQHINCQRVIRIAPSEAGKVKSVLDMTVDPETHKLVHSSKGLTNEETNKLASLAHRVFGSIEETDTRQTIVASNALIADCLKTEQVTTDNLKPYVFQIDNLTSEEVVAKNFKSERLLPEFNSILVGRIADRETDHIADMGYIFLINRINDLAFQKCEYDREVPNAQLDDYFDWEDEIYLDQICHSLDLIIELFTNEEARLRRAHILSHELQAPSGFIYATSERIAGWLDGKRSMPNGMARKELEDIQITSEYQMALVDSLMLGLDTSNQPPNSRYFPRFINLDDIAKNVARIIRPVCRKYRANENNIFIEGRLPRLYFDQKAAEQIFINIMVNSVKYSNHTYPDAFRARVKSEFLTLSVLEKSTHAPITFIKRMKLAGIQDGFLVSFSDDGIGILERDRENIFRMGVRSTNPTVNERYGAGLGLAVVRSILHDHFSEIWVESIKEPTEFNIFFPSILETTEYKNRVNWRQKIT